MLYLKELARFRAFLDRDPFPSLSPMRPTNGLHPTPAWYNNGSSTPSDINRIYDKKGPSSSSSSSSSSSLLPPPLPSSITYPGMSVKDPPHLILSSVAPQKLGTTPSSSSFFRMRRTLFSLFWNFVFSVPSSSSFLQRTCPREALALLIVSAFVPKLF